MSNLLIDDQSSCLKQFGWEELDENFFVAVIFRSGRRYVGQRHFEQQLFFVQSPVIQEKWRRTFFEFMSKSFAFISLTANESILLNEINTWHLNLSNDFGQFENLIDFENLFEYSTNFVESTSQPTFLFQPMTTLAAASRTLELWKEQTNSNFQRFSTGSIQIDGKILPFIQENSQHFLSIDFLLKESVINSSDEFVLRSSTIRIENEQMKIFNNFIREKFSFGSSRFVLNVHSSLIRLDEFLFRLKRLFFVRFLSSSSSSSEKKNLVDFRQIMSLNGGLITFNNEKQRIPFVFIQNQIYFPHFNTKTFSTNFVQPTSFQMEFLRCISTYEYLSTCENVEFLTQISSTNDFILIPLTNFSFVTTILFNDFHHHECQRRCQKQQKFSSDESNGWWQTPISSSKSKRSSSVNQLKIRPAIFF